ncbi:MAG: hypothetical protein C0393_02195 [Anaerolinea sp.]|nr:hypothetical protein [Anaerolinea sp.]
MEIAVISIISDKLGESPQSRMSHFIRNGPLETMEEQLDHLHESVQTESETAMTEAEGYLNQLLAIDDQLETRQARAEELTERAYQTYYATKNELLKIYHNNKRLVNTFFLE